MRDADINKAVAEACGWQDVRYSDADGAWVGREKEIDSFATPLPDYCHDLNAMHEAEKVMFPDPTALNACQYWAKELPQTVAGASGWLHRDVPRLAGATARQRAEAMLRTLGKWHDYQHAQPSLPG